MLPLKARSDALAALVALAIALTTACAGEPTLEARWYIVPKGEDCRGSEPPPSDATVPPPCIVVALMNRGEKTRTIRDVKLGGRESPQVLIESLLLEQDVLRSFRIPVFECKFPRLVSYIDESNMERQIDFPTSNARGLPLQVLNHCAVTPSSN